ncbi:hypothetical protein PHMEG_00019879 [Phytophthora megakarya]|uniref:Uncharacterized protein n=1 Tax=Phytophthora megakarya TaxID=4795 RepID=A0A225VQI4_9STRA|nr:hypothetical protein PHMEG_00019879 [Phytophthora megakarya]
MYELHISLSRLLYSDKYALAIDPSERDVSTHVKQHISVLFALIPKEEWIGSISATKYANMTPTESPTQQHAVRYGTTFGETVLTYPKELTFAYEHLKPELVQQLANSQMMSISKTAIATIALAAMMK